MGKKKYEEKWKKIQETAKGEVRQKEKTSGKMWTTIFKTQSEGVQALWL